MPQALQRKASSRGKWGVGSRVKATRLTEVHSLAVLSNVLEIMEGQQGRTLEEKSRARREWAAIIGELLGNGGRHMLEWFLNYEAQREYERVAQRHLPPQEEDRPVLHVSDHMVSAAAFAALGASPGVLPRTGFPFKGMDDYLQRGEADLPTWDLVDVVMIPAVVARGLRVAIGELQESSAREATAAESG